MTFAHADPRPARPAHSGLGLNLDAGSVFVPWLHAGIHAAPRTLARVGGTAAIALALVLVTACPFHGQAGPGAGGSATASGDTINKAQRVPDFGSGRRPSKGLIGSIFDRQPGEDRAPGDRTERQGQQPYVDEMRHAFGSGRQAYEVPLQEPRQPRFLGSAPRPPRTKRGF